MSVGQTRDRGQGGGGEAKRGAVPKRKPTRGGEVMAYSKIVNVELQSGADASTTSARLKLTAAGFETL